MKVCRTIPLTIAGLLIALAPAAAQQDKEELLGSTNTDWVSLTGKVKSVSDSSFILDYGKGEVAVEVDDFEWRDENAVAAGDDVTVTGMVDQDFYEGRKVEASSVFVDQLDTYFYASSADEEGGYYSYPVSDYASDDEWVTVTGTVVRREDETLTVDTGGQKLSVDVSSVGSDLKVDPGARVSVYGEMDDADLFEGRELVATSVVRLSGG
jgi:uncharacterized protein YdeI (BOF family)